MTETDELSFLPDDYKHRRIRRKTKVIGAAAVLVVIAAIGSNVWLARRSLARVQQEHAAAALAYSDAAQRIAILRRQREEQRATIRHALLAAALTDDVPPGNILAELTNSLPAGTSLVEVNLESRQRPEAAAAGNSPFDMKKAALESQRRVEILGTSDIPPQETIVKVCGLAEADVQVAQYLNQLSHSPLFQDVKLLVSETTALPGNAAVTLHRFQIQMLVRTGAHLPSAPDVNSTATALAP
jgi:hypothetical protein